MHVKTYPYSNSASCQQVDAEMIETRTQNMVSEFKTPTYISPIKTDMKDSQVKTVIPHLQVS